MKIIIEINPQDEHAFLAAAAEHGYAPNKLADFASACIDVTAHVEPTSVEVLVDFDPEATR